MPLTFTDGRIDYVCSKCGARGCKLWRDLPTQPELAEVPA